MRVIAGKARSLPLKAVEGLGTRPTTDRIKETLFNMLQSDIPGCRFLDLYAGSGAVGIEALSRGAKESIFVENAKNAISIIKENLAFTKLTDDGSCKADVMEMDVLSAINRLSGKGIFDIVFMDPPYNNDYEYDVLNSLAKSDIIDSYSIIIIEEAIEAKLDYIESCGFEIIKVKNYKTNKHLFIKLKEK